MRGAKDLPAHTISEGTLLVIGLLTVLMSLAAPRLVLMDNLDRALHPRAMGELVKHLRTILEKQPDLQIVATSHSPYLIDHLEPSEVLLTTLQQDGCALCAPLAEHPDFPKWKGLMSPGEFWSTVGEDWTKQQAKATHG